MMEWGKLLWCFSLLFIGSSVSDIQTLHDIKDLKGIEFGHEYPRHGLLLLHWLASHISVDQDEGILLHFNPVRRDYGFQHYRNSKCTQEIGLPHLNDSLDTEYYSLGSLSSVAIRTQLPPYVTQDFYNSLNKTNTNLDRIVVRVQKGNPMIADKVYVMSEPGCDYDQNKTHEVSPKLLRQVQALQTPVDLIQALVSDMFSSFNSSLMQSDDPRLVLTKDELITHLQYTKKLLSIFEQPGVRWLLTLAGYDIDARYDIHKQTWLCSKDEPVRHEESDLEMACEGHRPVKIEVRSRGYGCVKLTWSGIPKNILKENPVICLFKDHTTRSFQSYRPLEGRTSGSISSNVLLNHGLQIRLMKYHFGSSYSDFYYKVYWRGPQFDAANRVLPTEISGYNASLQLYTKDGNACARLYIKNSFTDWEEEFFNSWVGFYSREQDRDEDYEHYQWVSNFEKSSKGKDTHEYLIYEYESSMNIMPGVQARFLFSKETVRTRIQLKRNPPIMKARTVPWDTTDT